MLSYLQLLAMTESDEFSDTLSDEFTQINEAIFYEPLASSQTRTGVTLVSLNSSHERIVATSEAVLTTRYFTAIPACHWNT